MTDKVVEGVFAIYKPPGLSSAQVVRDVQSYFNPSKLFTPWIEEETARLKDARKHMHKQRFRKSRDRVQVKLGHGGTLDPMATGVLVLGVGAGTKRLGDFQSKCTKSYETVVLFGQATDSYDVVGKTVARAPYAHITEEKVKKALEKFRGESMQKPPIYSALRVQGKRLYEYAREGKEIPVEIQERPVTVHELEFLEWLEGGSHDYHWPQEEADEADKKVAEKVFHFNQGETTPGSQPGSTTKAEDTPSGKRAREEDTVDHAPSKRVKEGDTLTQDGEGVVPAADDSTPETNAATQSRGSCPAPACRIRMTVTSGFYVRSLCHDLGQAVDSLGSMAALVRTKQAEFELGKNVFEFSELDKGEEVWAPQIVKLLSQSATDTDS